VPPLAATSTFAIVTGTMVIAIGVDTIAEAIRLSRGTVTIDFPLVNFENEIIYTGAESKSETIQTIDTFNYVAVSSNLVTNDL